MICSNLIFGVTITALMCAGLVLTTYQLISGPIDCIVPTVLMEPGKVVIEKQCFIIGEFLIPDAKYGWEVSPRLLYYQWVNFVLLIQGLCLCVPFMIWARCERVRSQQIQQIVEQANQPDNINDEARHVRVRNLFDIYVLSRQRNLPLAFRASLINVVHFGNILSQILITNYLLNGKYSAFLREGIPFRSNDADSRVVESIFPFKGGCPFTSNTLSGSIQNDVIQCVLPLNPMHGKIYIFICWCFIAAIISVGLRICCDLIVMGAPRKWNVRSAVLHSRCPASRLEVVLGVVDLCDYGDWLFLIQLAEHPKMDPLLFCEFLERLPRSHAVLSSYHRSDTESH